MKNGGKNKSVASIILFSVEKRKSSDFLFFIMFFFHISSNFFMNIKCQSLSVPTVRKTWYILTI